LGNIWGKCLGRQEDKWGRKVEEEQPTVVIGQRGGDMGGTRTGICCTYHLLVILEREERNKDIRLHEGENDMRGEGGERIGSGLKLYTKATS
jgi:hypothetical protein